MPALEPAAAAHVWALAGRLANGGPVSLDEDDVMLTVSRSYIGVRFTRLTLPDSVGLNRVCTGLYHLTLAKHRDAADDGDLQITDAAHASLVYSLVQFIRDEQLVFDWRRARSLHDDDDLLKRLILPLDRHAPSTHRLFQAVLAALPKPVRQHARPFEAGGLHLSIDGPLY